MTWAEAFKWVFKLRPTKPERPFEFTPRGYAQRAWEAHKARHPDAIYEEWKQRYDESPAGGGK